MNEEQLVAEVWHWKDTATVLASAVFMGQPQNSTGETGGPGVCFCETPPRPLEPFDPERQHVDHCVRIRKAFAEIQRVRAEEATP